MKLAMVMATTGALICGHAALADEEPAPARSDAAALAEKLSNPVASLISVPFQSNFDFNIGPDDGWRYTLNIQPVVPIHLDDEWNLISRTILPVIYQEDVFPGAGSQFGLGDTLQSLFLSPQKPTSDGLIWGVGPAFLIPTTTDDLLGTEKFGLGPTIVALKQEHGWTFGLLANHIWSVAGDGGRPDVNQTFLQPFLSFTTHEAWTFGVNTESTYDWMGEQWSVPLNAFVSKLEKIEDQHVSFTLDARYWAASPENGPEGFGARFVITLLFPE